METEGKTLLRFYASNEGFECHEDIEGMEGSEVLKLVGMLDLVKHSLIMRMADSSISEEEE